MKLLYFDSDTYIEIKQLQTLFGISTTFLLSYETNDINDMYEIRG